MIEKISGCFLGLAVADALGVPVEFRSREYLANNPVKTMIGYGAWNQPPGTWSDDSSLTFCLAESLIAGYSIPDIAARFVRWYKEGYWGAHHKLFDIGGTTRNALSRIALGEDPYFSGDLEEESNGNGSLMRIVPAALYFHNLPDMELYQRIKEISAITHGHFRSVFSCFVFAKFVQQLIRGEEKLAALQNAGKAIAQFAAENDFNQNEIKLFERILNGSIFYHLEESINSYGYVLDTLEASIWCFVRTDSYQDAVLRAVNLGGDTDTTGCVTGALAGFYYGVDAIPTDWLMVLARHNDIKNLSNDFTQSLKKENFNLKT